MLQESKSVTVGVRIRPKLDGVLNALQSAERYEPMACSQLSDTTLRLWDGRATREGRTFFFAYDGVFDENTTQEEIYEDLVTAAVHSVLSGTNASVLTYGQTGSGKTHTILGGVRMTPSSDDVITEETGILLRALQDILHFADANKTSRHLVIGISAIEIYLDEVRDLLSDKRKPTVIQMAVMKEIVRFPKLTYIPIHSLHDGLKVFQKASSKRAQRMTFANDTSSRSHAVFNIEVFQQPITPVSRRPMNFFDILCILDAAQLSEFGENPPKPSSHGLFESASNALLGSAEAPIMYSKLSLADLAGSEKVRNSSVGNEGFDELKKINASLTSLGNVVHSLYERSRHIPYRDSKLTTVLRHSFAALNSRIVLIVNVSPTVLTVEETLSSLYFADKVKMVRTGPSGGSVFVRSNEMVYGYLSSLRKHDELTSDLRIAGVLHRFRVPQVIPLVACGPNNVLYDLTFRIGVANSEIRRMAISTLCDTFKTSVNENRNWVMDQEQEIEMVERTIRDETIVNWKKRVNELYDLINGVSVSSNTIDLTSEEIWNKRLEEAACALVEARTTRRGFQEEYNGTLNSLKDAEKRLTSVEEKVNHIVHTTGNGNKKGKSEDKAVLPWKQKQGNEDVWKRFSRQAIQAVESAKLRLEWLNLMCETRRLSIAMKEQKRQGMTKQSQAVYEWLRRAVWGMAGNAVVISHRRGKQRHRKVSRAVGDKPPVNSYSVARPRHYWQRRSTEDNPQSKGSQRYTRDDDEALLEEVVSFVKMGGEVVKYSRDGTCHRRLLYIETKAEENRLCWCSLGSLGRDGCIPLRVITHLWLGRGTAVVDGVNNNANDNAAAQYYRSWGLTYSRRGSPALVEFVCDTVAELEAWVIGIARFTGLSPIFATPMCQWPNNTNSASITDRTDGANNTDCTDRRGWETLNAEEVTFCREWHIPPPVYAETRQQLITRCTGRRSGGLRLSPWTLRSLVKLDIFRASAMWLRLHTEGFNIQPRGKVYCYVQLPARRDIA